MLHSFIVTPRHAIEKARHVQFHNAKEYSHIVTVVNINSYDRVKRCDSSLFICSCGATFSVYSPLLYMASHKLQGSTSRELPPHKCYDSALSSPSSSLHVMIQIL